MEGTVTWDAFRSLSREATMSIQMKPWMVRALRIMKFVLYIYAHILVIAGTAASKFWVTLMASNVKQKSVDTTVKYYKTCETKGLEEETQSDFALVLLVCLWLIQIIPDLFAALQALWRLNSEKWKGVSFLVIGIECSRTIGTSLLYFIIFPELDISRCILLSVFALFIPYYQQISLKIRRAFHPVNSLARRFSLLISSCHRSFILLLLLSSCYLWFIMKANVKHIIVLPIALILSAVGFWDAWIQPYHASSDFRLLYELKYGVRKLTASTRLCLSVCRVVLATVVLTFAPKMNWSSYASILAPDRMDEEGEENRFGGAIYALAFFIIFLNFFLRLASRLLAATNMRISPLLHPLYLVPPVLLIFSYLNSYITPICKLPFVSGDHKDLGLLWQSFRWTWPEAPFSDVTFTWIWMVAYIFWARSMVKSPIFEEDSDVIDSMTPVMNGLFIEHSLVVYRHSINNQFVDVDVDDSEEQFESIDVSATNDNVDRTITLYACATMWHETRNEMKQMLMSIMRVDKERSLIMAGKSSSGRLNFQFEAHIFFDDAWGDQEEIGRTPNEYFKTLFDLLLELTGAEGFDSTSEGTQVLVNTPYGGRLIMRLPAGTILHVHLKDKKLIRNKKRWSQVMYMYYLLGHRIMDSPKSVEDRQLEADNTYILAIDGDSKFQPSAVLKLLQLLDSKRDIGCACGRIHPLGNGVMVWYQKFEYAIAHWLQKAAEHAYGCVLCAPGCFSVFRASALMDDNVMHKYTKKPCEPRHFLQYDQGEDRWLSTLLLKQGYRIEYEAAADAETYAPEGFDEFYNQRRRWTPSSVANTLDLLADYKRACANNNSISKLYILYQGIVIGCAFIGPGIMFTMIVYSMSAIFQIHSDRVMVYNGIPLLLYIFLCFVAEAKHQLAMAKILSMIYAFIMVAVSVATACETALQTFWAPTSFFVLVMTSLIVLAAAMHPQEFYNIIYGIPFFLMIPCTYLFMSLYSLINLHVMSWGTRETGAKGGEAASDSLFGRIAAHLGLGGLVSYFAALAKKRRLFSDDVSSLESRVKDMEKVLEDVKDDAKEKKEETCVTPKAKIKILTTPGTHGSASTDDCLSTDRDLGSKRLADNRFAWMDQEYLQVCSRGRLRLAEENFWNELIDNYLKPHVMTAEESKSAADALINMRNHLATLILMVNGLFILTIYLVQRHKDVLSIEFLPYEGFSYMKWDEKEGKGYVEVTDEGLPLEPVGIVIIAILMGILLVQMLGMLIHRLNTFIGALNEISFLEDYGTYEAKDLDELKVLDNARQMVDRVYYSNTHGSDGFVRVVRDGPATSVVYKLQRSRLAKRMEKPSIPRRVGFD